MEVSKAAVVVVASALEDFQANGKNSVPTFQDVKTSSYDGGNQASTAASPSITSKPGVIFLFTLFFALRFTLFLHCSNRIHC